MTNLLFICAQNFLMIPAVLTCKNDLAANLLMIAIAINCARIVTIIYKEVTK